MMLRAPFAAVLLLVGTLGCAPTVSFDVPLDSSTQIEGAGILGGVLTAVPAFDDFVAFDLSTSEAFDNNNAQKDKVQQARLTLLRLTVSDPPEGDFDFLDEIAFFVAAPEVAEARVARTTFERGVASVELDLDDVDLAPYVRASSMTFTTEVTGRQPAEDTTVQAEAIINIVAGL